MTSIYKQKLFMAALVGAVALAGCRNLGPKTVAADRFDYSMAIANSWKQQTLLNIIKLRYMDLPVFMDVASVVLVPCAGMIKLPALWPLVYEHKPRVIVLDGSAIPDPEGTALKMLTESENKLKQMGIRLWRVSMNPEPLQLIQKSVRGKMLGRDGMYFMPRTGPQELPEAVR